MKYLRKFKVAILLALLGIGSEVRVDTSSVAVFLRSASKVSPKPEQYEVLFLDPPWDAAREYSATLGLLGGSMQAILAPGAVVVAEHRRKQTLDENYGSMKRMRRLEQGDAALSFFMASSAIPAAV